MCRSVQSIKSFEISTFHVISGSVRQSWRTISYSQRFGAQAQTIINKSSKNIRNYHKATKKYFFTHTQTKTNSKEDKKPKVFLLLHFCTINGRNVTSVCHAESHNAKKYCSKLLVKPYSGLSSEIQTVYVRVT